MENSLFLRFKCPQDDTPTVHTQTSLSVSFFLCLAIHTTHHLHQPSHKQGHTHSHTPIYTTIYLEIFILLYTHSLLYSTLWLCLKLCFKGKSKPRKLPLPEPNLYTSVRWARQANHTHTFRAKRIADTVWATTFFFFFFPHTTDHHCRHNYTQSISDDLFRLLIFKSAFPNRNAIKWSFGEKRWRTKKRLQSESTTTHKLSKFSVTFYLFWRMNPSKGPPLLRDERLAEHFPGKR